MRTSKAGLVVLLLLSAVFARYVDPVIGRWISKDKNTGKAFSPQSLNRYIYVKNNPLIYIDPDGLAALIMYQSTGADATKFQQIAEYVKKENPSLNYQIVPVGSGKDFINGLIGGGKPNDPIEQIIVVSHSWDDGLYFLSGEGRSGSFYTDSGFKDRKDSPTFSKDKARSVSDLVGADIYWGSFVMIDFKGCATAYEGKVGKGNSLAEQLAKALVSSGKTTSDAPM